MRAGSDSQPAHPSLGYLLKQWTRQTYDELGPVIAGSVSFFIVCIVSLAPAGLLLSGFADAGADQEWALPLHFALLVLGLWPVTGAWLALHRQMEGILTFQYPEWWEFWRLLPSSMGRALPAWALVFGVTAVLGFNLITYPQIFAGSPAIVMAAMTVTLWMLLTMGLVQVHLFPLIAHQNRAFPITLKRAAVVAAWMPIRTLLILMVEGVLLVLCAAIPFLFFLAPGAFAILSNLSLLILLDEWRDPYEKTPEAIRAGA